MRKYYSKADNWITITLVASIAIMWLALIPLWNGDSFYLSLSMTLLVAASTWLITSILLNTYYWISDNQIYWKTGPLKGSVSIDKVKKITRAQSIMDISAMVKPCLTSKPLLIRYNQYDDLPISPKDEVEFLREIKKLNSEIEFQF